MFLLSFFVISLLSYTVADDFNALTPFGSDSEGSTWIRAKRSCGGCCGGGSCCGMGSACASTCCSIPISITPACSCGSPGCSCGGCACGSPGCSCNGGLPSCACGTPGCSCSQASLVIPIQTCCKCCQPVCAPACIQGGGCSCGCNRGGCRRKRDLFQDISAYEASKMGAFVSASNL
uniref:Uncharacterized protein n=1 Tax=Panagrolaimus sp. ES5 TaxID=591445 RepID=A0AC34FD65_9BILA